MVDFAVLDAFGSTRERLKEVFTAAADSTVTPPPKANETEAEKKERLERSARIQRDMKVRQKFEMEFMTRIEEGILNSLKHWRLYAAADMAWDAAPINKSTMPLMMFAQGKIDVARCAKELEGTKAGADCIKKDEHGKVYIDVPTFFDTQVNLVRSLISRRHAAQKNKYNSLWPFYKYESRSTGLVGKCRADVLSQRVDMMADQFGYRNHDSQVIRDSMLYAHSVDFPRCSWEIEKQYRRKDVATDAREVDAIVVKEGIGWINPHPSRLFWDNNFPLSTINTDTGCEWIGFWDVMRWSDVEDNSAYFNKKVIGYTTKFWGDNGVIRAYADYFTNYSYSLMPPYHGEVDPSKANDRKANVGFYNGNVRDASIFVTNYFRKLVPKDHGIGNYPFPVWVRFVIASDNTTIYAEFMPSSPAAYLGVNENDSRQASISPAMDVMPYQDQMTNLQTHLNMACQAEVFKVVNINKDLLTPEEAEYVKNSLRGENWFKQPLVVLYSLQELLERGLKPPEGMANPVAVSETRQANTITVIFEAMAKLVALVEKLLALSPAEQGQPAPREISATEVSQIANTTSSIYSSISADIDEFRAAKKRIIYESLVCCGQGNVECPVKDRYTKKTIEAAGFEVKPNEEEDFTGDTKRFTVIGTKHALVHDYTFTSRDGDERPVNTQAANTLVQLIGLVVNTPTVLQGLGKEKLYEVINEIFRMSGAGIDVNLQLKEGESNDFGPDEMDQLKQTVEQLTQYMNNLAGQVKKDAVAVQNQQQVNDENQQAIDHLRTLADQVLRLQKQVHQNGAAGDIQKRLSEQISYKDAPPSIRRQMEQQAGLYPAVETENETPQKPNRK